MKRETGYYWVKVLAMEPQEWVIGRYTSGDGWAPRWEIVGWISHLKDYELIIDENKIKDHEQTTDNTTTG